MEYISGGSLAKVLSVGTQIPLKRVVEMMIDIAQGARAINEKLVHRDIKPDNILIEAGKLKIGDFGISKFVDESTRLHTFKGAQHIWYMAPEGWENQTNSVKIDVYAVGLVFYEILTLKHPLLSKVSDPNNQIDWQNAHLYEQCPDVRGLRSEVPLSIAQLLSRMVEKKASDRPYWDEVLKLLTEPQTETHQINSTVTAAVEAAVARKEQLQRKEMQARAQQDERQKQLGLYRYACAALLEKWDPIIEQFNRDFQYGEIKRSGVGNPIIYDIPLAQSIQVGFFEPKRGIKIRNGELIGGGWIGLTKGRSANLVLLKHGADDLYGHWTVCELKFMALVNPIKLIGQFGITPDTVEPFGLKAEYFYDQMQYATGTTHVFNYGFNDDLVGFFASLIHDAVTTH